MSNHLLSGVCSSPVYFSFIYHIFLFLFLVGKIWGGDLRGLLLPEFGHSCRTLRQVQTAGGAVDHTGQELAVFPAGRCSCHQSQVRHVTHYLEQVVNAKSTYMFKLNVIFQIRCGTYMKWLCYKYVGESNLKDFLWFCDSFLSKLEERVESDIMDFTVCDIIARHCQRFKMVYVPYLTNQSYQDATYQRLM